MNKQTEGASFRPWILNEMHLGMGDIFTFSAQSVFAAATISVWIPAQQTHRINAKYLRKWDITISQLARFEQRIKICETTSSQTFTWNLCSENIFTNSEHLCSLTSYCYSPHSVSLAPVDKALHNTQINKSKQGLTSIFLLPRLPFVFSDVCIWNTSNLNSLCKEIKDWCGRNRSASGVLNLNIRLCGVW